MKEWLNDDDDDDDIDDDDYDDDDNDDEDSDDDDATRIQVKERYHKEGLLSKFQLGGSGIILSGAFNICVEKRKHHPRD